jgi:hypothetical protein
VSLSPNSTITTAKAAGNPTFNFSSMPTSIVKVGATYYCAYARHAVVAMTHTRHIRLASAASASGPWTDLGSILTLGSQAWEETDRGNSCWLMEDGGTFYLFYDNNGDAGGATRDIGVATASTVTGAYTKYASNPIIQRGSAGAWDSRRVQEPSVIVQDGTWVMAYMGEDTDDPLGESEKIGIATASSPFGPWTKDADNPVVGFGTSGQFDDTGAADPALFHDGARYWMLYSGLSGTAGEFPWQLGLAYATTPNGTWTKYSGNPILSVGTAGAFDDEAAWRGSVYLEDGVFYGTYAGFPTPGPTAAGDFTDAKGGSFGLTSDTAPGVWIDWNNDGFADEAGGDNAGSLARMMPEGSTSGVFDNITDDVISFNWTRGGSSNHLSPSAPDSCTIIVKNSDGRYSPDNTASPLYGKLLPHRPVWIGRNDDLSLEGTGQDVHGVWAGRIRTVAPVMPVAGMTPTAQIICEGITGAYERAGAYVLGGANRTHAAMRQLILESMNETEARMDLDAETGVIDYSWVGGDLRETTKGIAEAESGLQALNELNSATGTRHFIRPSSFKDDWYQYVSTNRYWKLQSAADFTLNGDDIHAVPEWETGEASIITYQEAEYTPAEVLAAGTVWGPYTEVPFNMTVAASRTIWGRFEDFVPNGTAVVASTGATITQSFANYGRMFSLTLYASGNATVTAVHIEGDMLNRLDTERMAESSSATEAVYGRRNGQVVTSRFVGSPENGFGLTHFLIWKFAGPLRSGRVVIKNKPSIVNSRDLYDLATVTIDALHVANDRFEIIGEEGECNRATASGIADWTTTWAIQKCRNPEPLTDAQLAELE